MSTDINTEATRALANRAGNMFLPLYADGEDGWLFRGVGTDAERHELDKVFGATASMWSQESTDEAILQVFRQFARLLPKLELVSVYHDPATADFHWAATRCVLGGAGFLFHHELASMLVALYPQCALNPMETLEEWNAALREAHRVCGWPVGLGLAEWLPLSRALAPMDEQSQALPKWVRVAALFHIIKHLRFSPVMGLVVTHRGTAASFEPEQKTSIIAGAGNKLRQHLLDALGAPTKPGKDLASPWTRALTAWLGQLNTGDLIPRKPLPELPGTVQAGAWSCLMPDPTGVHGFIQHGQRLDGVWLARDGKIRPAQGDTADIVGFDWPLSPSGAGERAKFEAYLPRTYDATRTPAQVLRHGFPNLNWAPFGGNSEAAECLIDAILCAGTMRSEIPSLEREKPLVLCMPTVPALEDSTNQGKTKCAHAIARALCPGIPCTTVPDGSAAPNQRVIAAIINRYGSLCADEWRQPSSPQHLLHHDNLQNLITGGAVMCGQVYANGVHVAQLAQPIIASCKAIDAPPDIINRCLVLALDQLTDEQRARAAVVEEIENGALSLQMRLAALAQVEKHGLVDKLLAAERGSTTKGWRFNTLRALAAILFCERYGVDGSSVLDNTIQTMQQWLVAHTREADTTGLLSTIEEGSSVKVRLHTLFEDMTTLELEQVIAECRNQADGQRQGANAKHVLRGIMCAHGFGSAPMSMMVRRLTNTRVNASDRSICLALVSDIRATCPQPGDAWVLPGTLGMAGWRMLRRSDVGGSPRIEFVKDAPANLSL